MPHLGDMKPFGKYHMVDLDKIGGVPVVSKILLENNLLEYANINKKKRIYQDIR